MFRRRHEAPAAAVTLTVEGRTVEAAAGESVAAAALAAGVAAMRDSPVGGGLRGPWCMMGVCFECLMEIDGVPNRQACMTPVAEGMTMRRQRAPGAAGA